MATTRHGILAYLHEKVINSTYAPPTPAMGAPELIRDVSSIYMILREFHRLARPTPGVDL